MSKARSNRNRDDRTAASRGSGDTAQRVLLGGAAALLVARPLLPSEAVASEGDGLVFVLAWLLLAVGWSVTCVVRRTMPYRFGAIDAAVALLLVWHSTSALVAASREAPRPAYNMLWEWLALGTSFFVVRQLMRTRADARALMAVMIALSAVLTCLGLHQYFVTLPETRAAYAADPDAALRAAGQWAPKDSVERILFEKRLESTEPMATFALANSLAGFLATWLIAALGVVAFGWRNETRRTIAALLVYASGVVVCLLLTKSRSAYAAVLVGVALIWLISVARGRRIAGRAVVVGVAAVAVVVVALAMGGGLDVQVLSEAPISLAYRWQYWRGAFEIIDAHPVFGCGPGNFGDHYTAYKLPEASEAISDPHDFVLELAATAGMPAAVAMLLVLGIAAAMLVRRRRAAVALNQNDARAGPGSDASAFIVTGGLAGYVVACLVGPLAVVPLSIGAAMVGLVVAGAMLWLLAPWIQHGDLPPAVPAAAATVLCVNLLAAGGIGFPGVAGSLWLCVALAVTLLEVERPPATARCPAALAAMAASILLATACYLNSYQPVLQCRAETGRAFDRPHRAVEHIQAAAAADAYAWLPWSQLAAVEFQQWSAAVEPRDFERIAELDRKALKRRPRASGLWLEAAERLMTATQRTGEQRWLDEAIDAYRTAVDLYPNNALRRARLAEALEAAGRRDEARREAIAALELDARTPHTEQKLPAAVREALERRHRPSN